MDKMKCKLEDFQAIVQLFQDDADGHLDSAYIDYSIVNRLFINGGFDEQNELMLRLNTYQNQLTVARVHFIHQRQGYGEKLFELLNEYGKNNGYETIVVESVITHEMKQFLMKHGFELASDYEFEMNWKRKIQ